MRQQSSLSPDPLFPGDSKAGRGSVARVKMEDSSVEGLPCDEPPFSLCVYCGSRPGKHPAFEAVAREVGAWLGARGGELVFGGGRNGLMGVVADATLAAGGRVYGVIPQALVQQERAHTGCTELHIVENMHDRKRMMAERAQAFLALPGGIGTLEEFFEVWTWRQLGYHDKPIGLLNSQAYYGGLIAFLDTAVVTEFMHPQLMELVLTGTEPQPLLESLLLTGRPGRRAGKSLDLI